MKRLLPLPVRCACTAPSTLTAGGTRAEEATNDSFPAFNAEDWLARARSARAEFPATVSEDAAHVEPALAEQLDGAVGWQRDCDSFCNPDTEQMAATDSGGDFGRGLFSVYDSNGRAMLLRGQSVGYDGTPNGPPTATYAEHEMNGGTRFTTFSRGTDACGIVETTRSPHRARRRSPRRARSVARPTSPKPVLPWTGRSFTLTK